MRIKLALLPLAAVSQVESRKHSRRVRRRRRRVFITFISFVALIAVGLGATAGYGWYLNHQIDRVPIKGLMPEPTSGAEANTENILMIGSTNRCALTEQNPAYGLCSQGVTGINSDVVMILHLDPATHGLTVLSIPRDLFVPNARATGANKIDAALVEGPSQLVAAIQEDFGIPIQHYVELNFDTFANVVNALGGIKMYFPEPVYDAYSGLDIKTTGCLQLNGVEALQVVRARHLQYKPASLTTNDVALWPYDPNSDLARILRDHEFLRVLATTMAKKGLSSPITDEQIISAVAPQLQVDSGFSASQMVSLVRTFHSVNANNAPQLSLPVLVDGNGSYVYDGGNYGDIEFPSLAQDRQTIDEFLGVNADTDTMTGAQLVAPRTVSVSVMNGTGVTDQAAQTADNLQTSGFKIIDTGNTDPVAQQSETVVYYGSEGGSGEADAETVAHALSGVVIMAYDPKMMSGGADVTVVTGTDFSVDNASLSDQVSSTVSSGTHLTAVVTQVSKSSVNGASSTAGLSAPSSSNPPLEPWDPRSCTSSGGEGP
jgi:LCP family protein required for cell wall assembly